MSGIQFEYNLLARNQARLHDISIDSVSGIQTFIDNSAKSPNTVITSVEFDNSDSSGVTVDAVEALPGVAVQSILKQETPINQEENKINERVNSLSEKQVKVIGATFLGIIAVIILIAIFK